MSQLIGIKELQELLGISERTIRRLLAERSIPAYKIGQRWRFDPKEVKEAFRQDKRHR
jgi:excisionase family DNA binding protein